MDHNGCTTLSQLYRKIRNLLRRHRLNTRLEYRSHSHQNKRDPRA